jgi:hypothetical protein
MVERHLTLREILLVERLIDVQVPAGQLAPALHLS